jgi:hypothetical protein
VNLENLQKWNNNFERVTGYESSGIEKIHPLDLYDIEEKEKVRSRIKPKLKMITKDRC